MTPHRTVVRNGHVLTMDPTLGDIPAGEVLIEDGVITAVAPSLPVTDAEVLDATAPPRPAAAGRCHVRNLLRYGPRLRRRPKTVAVAYPIFDIARDTRGRLSAPVPGRSSSVGQATTLRPLSATRGATPARPVRRQQR
jgi:hypothetical protein